MSSPDEIKAWLDEQEIDMLEIASSLAASNDRARGYMHGDATAKGAGQATEHARAAAKRQLQNPDLAFGEAEAEQLGRVLAQTYPQKVKLKEVDPSTLEANEV